MLTRGQEQTAARRKPPPIGANTGLECKACWGIFYPLQPPSRWWVLIWDLGFKSNKTQYGATLAERRSLTVSRRGGRGGEGHRIDVDGFRRRRRREWGRRRRRRRRRRQLTTSDEFFSPKKVFPGGSDQSPRTNISDDLRHVTRIFFLEFKIFQAGRHFETLSCYVSGVTGGGVASVYCQYISIRKSIYCWRLRCQKEAFLFMQFRNDPA